jgi:hypothetical protein
MNATQPNLPRNNQDGSLDAFAWPGGYPIFYLCEDSGVLCPDCARTVDGDPEGYPQDDPQWHIVAADVHWEGAPMFCDNCNAEIESAYGDPEKGGAPC